MSFGTQYSIKYKVINKIYTKTLHTTHYSEAATVYVCIRAKSCTYSSKHHLSLSGNITQHWSLQIHAPIGVCRTSGLFSTGWSLPVNHITCTYCIHVYMYALSTTYLWTCVAQINIHTTVLVSFYTHNTTSTFKTGHFNL